MTTILRKLLVLGMVAMVLMLASIYEVVRWLTRLGVTDMAEQVADRYLTGTAVAVIVVMVLLLRSDRPRRHEDHSYYPPDYRPPPYPRRPRWW
jgi:hypothetical protein